MSQELPHRLDNFDANISETLRGLEGGRFQGRLNKSQQNSMRLIGSVQRGFVDRVMFYGSFMREIDADPTLSADKAAQRADQDLVRTQGSGMLKDMSAIQRSPVWKMLAMFQTFFLAQHNVYASIFQGAKKGGNMRKTTAFRQLLNLVVIGYVVSQITSDDEPPDDEDNGWWYTLKMLGYAYSGVPFVGDILESAADGFSRGISALSAMPRNFQKVLDAWSDDEADIKDVTAVAKLAGTLRGVPGTVEITDTLEALEDEDADFWDILVTGPPRKSR
jgi:hypothetical protein